MSTTLCTVQSFFYSIMIRITINEVTCYRRCVTSLLETETFCYGRNTRKRCFEGSQNATNDYNGSPTSARLGKLGVVLRTEVLYNKQSRLVTRKRGQVVAQRSEFTVSNTYPYNRSNPIRWIFSHVLRYKFFFFSTCALYMTAWISNTYSRILVGRAAGEIIAPTAADGLLKISIAVLFILLLDSLSALGGSLLIETIAQRLTRDSREELYIS